ncbi:hypothetical protein Bca4012_029797 [Brassica carinata]|uniref:BnaC04g12580D protein n=2 Tax=Brassica TaxID=3705 RepID=A0A078FJD3_BRANA|nr:uncharacterized protein LOC106379156 isoform X1 [Brassica napus]XP_048610126.1 uncharacterized protein LOC106379156 isoform X1 [Brassica napus]CDY12228.1 BnaC04g12580D [Brassica napus]VDD07004.1 unnamed protein product [Brassica oleracea]
MNAQEVSADLQALFAEAIEATYLTRNIDGIERCVDALSRLKSASLSVSDIQLFSKSIFRLETLRTHKSPKISEVSQSLFDSWLSTLYGQGRRDQSLEPKTKKTETLLAKTERDIKDKDGGSKVTTKTLLPPPRRLAACKNPNSAEMVELFEAAKKAADVANAKGILSGKADALRCVEAISLLMKMNVTPKPNEPRRMIERLQVLTKHKDRTICNAASALLQLWRQRTREQERKAASTIDMILCKPRHGQQIRGQGFTGEPTKTRKLVM